MNVMETGDNGTTEFVVANEAEMDAVGHWIADAVETGLVIALVGDLGAGKTRLARAVATSLGADPHQVNSPTFVLVQRYNARLPVYHFDTYRLRDAEEFADLGPEEMFQSDAVCLIEWADRVADYLPDDRLLVEIETTGTSSRSLRITATGNRSRAMLRRLVTLGG